MKTEDAAIRVPSRGVTGTHVIVSDATPAASSTPSEAQKVTRSDGACDEIRRVIRSRAVTQTTAISA